MSYKFNKAALLTGTIMAGAMVVSPAYAQVDEQVNEPALEPGAADAEIAPIIVTGSRIARRNVETAAPVAVVQDEEFELSGTVNVENVINTLPQVIPGTTSFSNNPGNGAATLNLRGLGAARTLVLVNDRRWMFYDTAQIVDLNTIPSFLLDSVDVVTGGASAVYGSDALAGVVNFRLRDIEGVELGGQYSITERGDGARYEVHGAIGTSFDDGRGNATVFAEYFNRSSIFQSDRGFSNFALGGESFGAPLQQFGSGTVPEGRINASATTTVRPALDLNGDGDTSDAGEAAVTAPLAQGLLVDNGVFFTPGTLGDGNGYTYNYAPANYLQLPQERYLIGGYADYDIGGGHTMYTEVAFVNNRVAQELAATPVTGTYNVNIDAVSPFLDQAAIDELNILDQREAAAAAQRQAFNDSLGYCGPGGMVPEDGTPCFGALPGAELGVVSTGINRRVIETGSRNSLDERNAFRVLGGMRGPINDYLSYDAYYMYARTRNANVQAGNISRSAFQAALDGSAPAINIFGLNTLTPAQVDQISIQAQNGDISTLENVVGTVSGTFGDFAIGTAEPVGFALGGEYRRVASQFLPDTALASGDVIGFNAGSPTEGAYDVKEVFGELNIPIEFGSARLELTGAARYSDYSLEAVGGTWTYAGGVQFSPIPDITLRGQYQRAVRAPNVGELFGGQAIGFPGATDPCGSADFLAANPGAGDLCVQNGVPAGNLGTGDVVQPNAQIPALFGGNPDLQEETSTSWTAGVVLQPSFFPGFTLTADYFDIKVEDFISIAGGSLAGLLNLCFGEVQDLNSPVCEPFVGTRNGDGTITVDNPPLVAGVNVAEYSVSGVDLQATYSTVLPFSLLTGTGEQDLNLSFLGTWTESNSFRPVADLERTIVCDGRFGVECGDPTASFKWTARASFIDGPLTTSVRWRHLSGVEDDDDTVNYNDFNGVERIPAYDLVDLTFSFMASESTTFTIGVNNLFDTLPQTPTFNGIIVSSDNNGTLLGDNQEQANTYPSTFDVLGRDFFASINFKF
ncbi:TonB-dependent receptor [Erythrobacter vulgaris]|uniref:TonB-dependent receptor n=1 Tax=Qipengyuania vulgaris TaxID=291985 RepID=A0A844XP16_9SPHN|nr:TonB-dependent receptor [Qipengyuania vulgaris]MXO47164.1 TonB-dependent receptor [Qipengyuania vulgaris]